MKLIKLVYGLIFLLPFIASGQVDTDPPATPVLYLVTVRPEDGFTLLTWTRSSSPDVDGYVIYDFRNGEGFAIDTIHNPSETVYLNTQSAARYRSESYVVAAFDTAGNISPLSNELRTIFTTSVADTCNKKIVINWNSYISIPLNVSSYSIYTSEDGGPWLLSGSRGPGELTYDLNDFKISSNYCFIVKAELGTGNSSGSSISCTTVSMQRPPAWINADYCTTDTDNAVKLSFTFDPASEINIFRLERKTEVSAAFQPLTILNAEGSNVEYTDNEANPETKYYYRLVAINNCGNAIVSSQVCSNIVLSLEVSDINLLLRWNNYRNWYGGVKSYIIELDPGTGFLELQSVGVTDTLLNIDYRAIMLEPVTDKICFRLKAEENPNQYGISGVSISNTVCTETIEKIFVPNTFTPDGDLINDLFAPVLSFIPLQFRMIITDRQNNIIFETLNHLDKWDGTKSGSSLPPDVYLWYLSVRSPAGKSYRKSGTVTIMKKNP